MKQDIHPEYTSATIRCACGNVIKTKSTLKTIDIDVCSSCHPFFTGKQKVMDTAGRIERFKKKFGDKVVGTGVKKEKKERGKGKNKTSAGKA